MPVMLIVHREILLRADALLCSWRGTGVAHEQQFLLSMNDLVRSVRAAVDLPGLRPAPADHYMRMLECGAGECAVLQLLTDESAYMFSRGSDGVHMATVVLAGWDVEATASARTGGLALAGAILLSLTQNGSTAAVQQSIATVSAVH
jgi:hypothetical protein